MKRSKKTSLGYIATLFVSLFLVCLLSANVFAGSKVKGEVSDVINDMATCEKNEDLKAKGLCEILYQGEKGPSSIIILGKKEISLEEGDPIILKSKKKGKTTAKLIGEAEKFDKDKIKECKEIIIWKTKERLFFIEPSKEFTLNKGDIVRMKVKRKVQKVEGC